MKYSISEAARIVGVTRKTLYKHIEKRPISIEKDDSDRPVIDASELVRVYGDQCRFEAAEPGSQDTTSIEEEGGQYTKINNPKSVSDAETLEAAVLKKELEMLQKQLRAEKDGYEEQIDYLRAKLDESLGETRKLTALLTDQSNTRRNDGGGEGWEKTLKALESRIANQEQAAKTEKEERQKILRQNHALKKALETEKSKTLWQRLLG